ncbi:MAG: Crp/Fnr family transcriptional regulator [Gammaproteobacteria bacterium]|nr:Crp/Fnr family transcriptional regulator [Gammaproteobacteria bacterium]
MTGRRSAPLVGSLGAQVRGELLSVVRRRHQAAPGELIIEQGRPATALAMIEEGWAMRFRDLDSGCRQIMDFVLPGDFCDPCVLIAERSDFSVAAITGLTYSLIEQAELLELIRRVPHIALALWWDEAAEADRLRSHLAAVGRTNARERIAQLLIELYFRLQAIHQTIDHRFAFPLTQEMIADATGLTAVHVNRVLCRMEREGLIRRDRRALALTDFVRLQEIAHAPMALLPGRLLRQAR